MIPPQGLSKVAELTAVVRDSSDSRVPEEARPVLLTLADGRVTIENGGSAAVCLVIRCKRLKRGSIISRAEVEAIRLPP